MILSSWYFINSFFFNFNIKIEGYGLTLNIILALVFFSAILLKIKKIELYNFNLAFIFIIIYSTIALFLSPCIDNFQKFYFSALPLYLMMLISYGVGVRASRQDWEKLDILSALVCIIVGCSLLLEIAMPTLFPSTEAYRFSGKYSGISSEPSVLACTIFPYILILLESKRIFLRRFGFGISLFFLTLSPSLTLVIYLVSCVFYKIIFHGNVKNYKYIIIISVIIAISLISYSLNTDNYYYDRVIGIINYHDTVNLSSLVYVQGWQLLWSNLLDSHGLGIGINMMGCNPLPNIDLREIINSIYGIDANVDNGTFIFSKIISEFGVLGIIFYILIFIVLIRNLGKKDFKNSLIIIYAFLVGSFVRCPGGYFTPELFLLIPSVIYIISNKKSSNNV